jgi:PKD repeat protein
MKKVIFSLMAIIFGTIATYAQCSLSLTSVNQGSIFQFTPIASNPSSTNYNFITIDYGDGTPVTSLNGFHNYASAGTYTVTSILQEKDSITANVVCSATFTMAVTAPNSSNNCNYPSPSFSNAPGAALNSIDFNFSSNFNNAGINPYMLYSIDFGDGTSTNNVWSNNINHSYNASGTYTATLTQNWMGNNNTVLCTKTSTTLVNITYVNPCTVSPTMSITQGVTNGHYNFTNTTSTIINSVYPQVIKWSVDFGDGSSAILNGTTPKNHFYAISGTYNPIIKYEIMDSLTMNIVCSNTATYTLTVTSSATPYTGCNANFYFTQDSLGLNPSPLQFYFDNSSVAAGNNITNYSFDFGDGSTPINTTFSYTTHTYAAPGTYQACLTITTANGCTDATCYDIVVHTPNLLIDTLAIQGQVQFAANGQVVSITDGTVYILKMDNVSNTLQLVRSAKLDTWNSGSFYFDNLPVGDYLVKAAVSPANIQFNNVAMPTYYNSELFWNGANTVTINQNNFNQFINLNLLPGTGTTGTGLITGNVIQGANKAIRGPGDAKAGLTVVLLDNAGKALDFAKTNKDGDYSFKNLKWGTYKIFIEEPGKSMTPAIVTLSASNTTNTTVDFISNSKTNYPAGVTSIEPELLPAALLVYPNPVQQNLSITATDPSEAILSIEIVNSMGAKMQATRVEAAAQSVKIDTDAWAVGLYFVSVKTISGTQVYRVSK